MKMKNNKLLFICPSYPSIGGVETVTSLLVDFFLLHGLDVSILVSSSDSIKGGVLDKHSVLMTVMKNEPYSKEYLNFMDDFIRDNDIACVINQGLFSEIYLRAYLHKDVLFINTLHSFPFWELEIFRLRSLSQLFEKEKNTFNRFKVFVRFVLNHVKPGWSHPSILSFYKKQIDTVSYYIVLDPSYKIMLEKRLYGGVDQKKIVAIPNPLILPERTFSPKKKQVIWVGRLAAVPKRADRMLRIWKMIQSEVPDWELLIIGDGDQREALEKMATDLHLINTCFMGYQKTDPYYESASILCLTSSYEGFPMVLLEAQSHGTIPVSFNCVEAIEHIIDTGKNGLIVESFNEESFAGELLKLIKDESLQTVMRQEAREKASEFTLEKIGQRWLKLLQIEK